MSGWSIFKIHEEITQIFFLLINIYVRYDLWIAVTINNLKFEHDCYNDSKTSSIDNFKWNATHNVRIISRCIWELWWISLVWINTSSLITEIRNTLLRVCACLSSKSKAIIVLELPIEICVFTIIRRRVICEEAIIDARLRRLVQIIFIVWIFIQFRICEQFYDKIDSIGIRQFKNDYLNQKYSRECLRGTLFTSKGSTSLVAVVTSFSVPGVFYSKSKMSWEWSEQNWLKCQMTYSRISISFASSGRMRWCVWRRWRSRLWMCSGSRSWSWPPATVLEVMVLAIRRMVLVFVRLMAIAWFSSIRNVERQSVGWRSR